MKTKEVLGFQEKPNQKAGDGLLGGAGAGAGAGAAEIIRDNQEAQILRRSAPNIFHGEITQKSNLRKIFT